MCSPTWFSRSTCASGSLASTEVRSACVSCWETKALSQRAALARTLESFIFRGCEIALIHLLAFSAIALCWKWMTTRSDLAHRLGMSAQSRQFNLALEIWRAEIQTESS